MIENCFFELKCNKIVTKFSLLTDINLKLFIINFILKGGNMLDIFVLWTCPYCLKVMKFLDENGLKYNPIDISVKQNEEALIKIGGKRQVPFLVDKENKIEMYESNDIIEYLKTLI